MKPRIVILSSRFPYPLTKGDKVRLYHQIKVLNEYFDVHLICLSLATPLKLQMDAISEICKSVSIHVLSDHRRKRNVLRFLGSSMPMQVRYFYDGAIHREILRDVEDLKPQYVFTQLVRMAPYVTDLDARIKTGLDFMDSMVLNDLAGQYLSTGFLRLFRKRERKLIKRYEVKVAGQFDDLYIISERDKNQMSTSFQELIIVANNGVVVDKIDGVKEHEHLEEFDVVFCGNLSYEPNRRAAHYLAKRIMSQLPEYTCLIAGAQPGSLQKELASKNVTIRGFQERLKDVYHIGKCMVAPIFSGSGQQNKVLEAMSCKTPCIVSSFVNEAIQGKVGRDLLLADDENGFIEHIKSLILHADKRESISRSGLAFVSKQFNWSNNTMPLVKRIKESIEG